MITKGISFCIFIISIFPFSIFLSKDKSYFYSWMERTPKQFVLGSTALALIFIGLSKLPKDKYPSFLSKILKEYFQSRYIILVSVIVIFLSSNLISLLIFEHIPHIQDSICQLFQAKIFLSGNLYTSPPVHKDFFRFLYIIDNNKWYSQYPPAHSFFLMLGLLFNVPWLINPIFGAISAIVLYKIGKEVYDLKTSNLSLLLFTASPFLIFMSSEYMNHASTMFFILLFVLYFIKMIKTVSPIPAFISGLSLGIALNIRPLEVVAIGFPFMVYLLFIFLRDKRFWKAFLSIALGFSLMLFVLLTYNYLTNGNPLLFGYNVYENKSNLFGFVEIPSEGLRHTPLKGFLNTLNNLYAINKYLFEWPIPSLTFIFIFFFLKNKRNQWDKIFIISSISLLIFYFFYYFPYMTFGPRFLYSSMPFLVLLTARGVLCIPEKMAEKSYICKESCEIAIMLIISISIIFMIVFSLPKLFNEYHGYFGVDKKLHESVEKNKIHNAVVFIDTSATNYSIGFQYNSPELDTDVIYARDLGRKNIELMNDFTSMSYYLYRKNEKTQRFELIPLSAGVTY